MLRLKTLTVNYQSLFDSTKWCLLSKYCVSSNRPFFCSSMKQSNEDTQISPTARRWHTRRRRLSKSLIEPQSDTDITETESKSDFYGISSHNKMSTTEAVVPVALDSDTLHVKYPFLSKTKSKKSEIFVAASYGDIRFDNQKQLRNSKEFEIFREVSSKLHEISDKYEAEATLPRSRNLEQSKRESASSKIKTSYREQSNKKIRQKWSSDVPNNQEKDLAEEDRSSIQAEPQSRPVGLHKNQEVQSATGHLKDNDNLFDSQYFGNTQDSWDMHTSRKTKDKKHINLQNENGNHDANMNHQLKGIKNTEGDNEFDKQYFSQAIKNKFDKNAINTTEIKISDHSAKNLNDPPNYFDEIYFADSAQSAAESQIIDNNFETEYSSKPERSDEDFFGFPTIDEESTNVSTSSVSLATDTKQHVEQMKPSNIGSIVSKQRKKMNVKPLPNVDKPQSAFDYAMKVRREISQSVRSTKEKQTGPEQALGEKLKPKSAEPTKPFKGNWSGKVDTKGYKVWKGQLKNFDFIQEDVMAQILRDSIIYDEGGPGVHHSVGKLLPKVAKLLDRNLDTLHLIHRLDKETTGVMLLARDEVTAEKAHSRFIKRQVIKRYWVITRGIPNPKQGVIDIPMTEGTVSSKYRMTLRPVKTSKTSEIIKKTSKHAADAVTKYDVLDYREDCALVEVEPATGIKHQIRCHLAFALNTPILGDHKYSHYSKIAPQKLSNVTLQKLGIRQSKVRHLPMHLHAQSIIIPEFQDGQNLYITTRLPRHFVQNMKWLKLSPPHIMTPKHMMSQKSRSSDV